MNPQWEPVFYFAAQGLTLAGLVVMTYLTIKVVIWAWRGGDE